MVFKKIKEFIAPGRGYSDEQIKEAEVETSDYLSGGAKYVGEAVLGISQLAASGARRFPVVRGVDRFVDPGGRKSSRLSQRLSNLVRPTTAGQAQVMRSMDILTLPAGFAKVPKFTKGMKILNGIKDSTVVNTGRRYGKHDIFGVGVNDLDVFPDSKINPKKVTSMKQSMDKGRLFNPIIVETVDGNVVVKDGNHRLMAMREAGREFVEVIDVTPEPKLGPKTPTKKFNPANFDPYDYSARMSAKAEAARGKKSITDKANNFLTELENKTVDFAAPLERPFKTAIRVDHDFASTKVDDFNIQDGINNVLHLPSKTEGFIKSRGLSRVIEQASEAGDLDDFDQYLIARSSAEAEAQGIKTGRSLAEDQALVAAWRPKYEKMAVEYNKYTDSLLDYLVDSNLYSRETVDSWRKKYPNYIPFNRIFDEERLAAMAEKGSGGTSKGLASVATGPVKKRVGSELEIESPTRSTVDMTYRFLSRGEKNKAAKELASYKDLEGNPYGLVPLRTTENVTKRTDIYKTLSESKAYKDLLAEILKTDSRTLRRLESEINSLEKSGLRESLKKSAPVQAVDPISPKKTKLLIDNESLKKFRKYRDNFGKLTKSIKSNKKVMRELSKELDKLKKVKSEDLLKIENKDLKLTKRPERMIEIILDLDEDGLEVLRKTMEKRVQNLYLNKEKAVNRKLDSAEKKLAELFDDIESTKKEVSKLKETGTGSKKIDDIIGQPNFGGRLNKLLNTLEERSFNKTVKADDILVTNSPRNKIESFLATDTSKLRSIRKKLAKREPKLSALIDQVNSLQRSYDKINLKRQDLFDEVRALKDAESKGKSIISFFDNGIKNVYEVNTDIARAAKMLDVQQLGLLGKIIAFPTRLARLGITGIDIGFTLTNLARDQVSSAIFSDNGLRASILNPKIWTAGIREAFSPGNLTNEILSEAGLMTSFDLAKNTLPLTVEKLAAGRSKTAKVGYLIKNPSQLLDATEDAFSKFERITRIQQYMAAKEVALAKGLTTKQAKLAGARAARENSVNFARRGEFGAAMNVGWLYLNAGIQGSRLLVRSLKNKPKETTAKIATNILLPTTVMTYYNLANEERRAVYDDIPEYEKENNLIMIGPNPVKDPETGKWSGVFKFPIPPGVGKFASQPRRLIEQSYGLDPVKFSEVAVQLLDTFSPIDPQKPEAAALPVGLKGVYQAKSNYNFFTERPIVPQGLSNVAPEEQTYDHTSGTARRIGGAIGTSPIKVEQFARDQLGGIGPQILNTSDRVLSAAGAIPPEQVGGRTPLESIIRRFYGAAGNRLESERTSEIYDKARESNTDSKKRKEEAEKLYEDLGQLPVEEADSRLDELEQADPLLYEEIQDIMRDKQSGIELSTSERALKRLRVSDGSRAEFIYKELKKILQEKGGKAADAYLDDLEEKKIYTREVDSQVAELLAEDNV